MDLKLLTILQCTSCSNKFSCQIDKHDYEGYVIEGELTCNGCSRSYPIVNYIPRFVSASNYATSFGYQWNLYKHTQLDNYSRTDQSKKRFFSETDWNKADLKNNWVLDIGCGNGRFIDICSQEDCQIVGVDISEAIDAAGELFKNRRNVHLIQASVYDLPFMKETFDKCYSIGVIQHTPNPEKAIEQIPKLLKNGGKVALTIYEKKRWTFLYGKYLARHLTKRLNKKILLLSIKLASLVLFPLTEVVFRIPWLNQFFRFVIPYANYTNLDGLSITKRFEWAILDTFDMLSPAYDNPMTEKEVFQCLNKTNMKNIKRLQNPGVNVIAIK